MIICSHCGLKDEKDSWSFQMDGEKGFWCEDCDGYTYLTDDEPKHRFKLILEDERIGVAINNNTKKKLSKRLSVYRYPGGKSKIINYLYNELKEMNTGTLVSPFTGGGSFELAMLEAGVVDNLILNDLDTGVSSLYWVIKHFPEDLIHRIKTSNPNHSDFYEAQKIIRKNYEFKNVFESAWISLLVNRLAYSGISKAGPMGGKKGTIDKLQARWNPDELIRRIKKIHSFSHKYEILNMDAAELIEEYYWKSNTTIFIDPPYLLKGEDLYDQFYQKRDHIRLSVLLDTLSRGVPGADIIVTYDYHEFIEEIFEVPEIEVINRKYSI